MTTVYQTTSFGDAQLRFALVERGRADLLVHRVASRALAQGDALWFITRDRAEATLLACFVSPGMAQVSICFVDNPAEARWQVPHRLRGRLG